MKRLIHVLAIIDLTLLHTLTWFLVCNNMRKQKGVDYLLLAVQKVCVGPYITHIF